LAAHLVKRGKRAYGFWVLVLSIRAPSGDHFDVIDRLWAMTSHQTRHHRIDSGAIMTINQTTNAPPPDDLEEVRLAVVMYGGVSLAIYLYGMTQELLRMVRATVPGTALTGTEVIYRQLASLRQGSRDERIDWDETDLDQLALQRRFVIDILSGTSAGGINAVFLAKALVNNQSIDHLNNLWLKYADLGLLLNDARGDALAKNMATEAAKNRASGRPIPDMPHLAEPPALLNGQRMYSMLFDAFREMSDSPGTEVRPACVESLDLFITATDVNGLEISVPLTRESRPELRHRHVFEFRYRPKGTPGANNQFTAEYDPLLAFAARCTSSFPVAFPPMRLEDIDEVLKKHGVTTHSRDHKWQAFFPAYLQAPSDLSPSERYVTRPFADGGILDNKPFGYAINAIFARPADRNVTRKLVYLEPQAAPSRGNGTGTLKIPDAIGNGIKALVNLPTYEAIATDLSRITEYNERIQLATGLPISGIDLFDRDRTTSVALDAELQQLLPAASQPAADPWLTSYPADEWDEALAAKPSQDSASLPNLLRTGRLAGSALVHAYISYYRLKVKAVTEELAEAIALIAGWAPTSPQGQAILALVTAWRETTYSERRVPADTTQEPRKPSLNRFLLRFDLSYRTRRLYFVRDVLDMLIDRETGCFKDKAAEFSAEAGVELPVSPEVGSTLAVAVRLLRKQLTTTVSKWLSLPDLLRRPETLQPLKDHLKAISAAALQPIIMAADPVQRQTAIENFLADHQGAVKGLAEFIEEQIRETAGTTTTQVRAALEAPNAAILTEETDEQKALAVTWRRIRNALVRTYARFESFDVSLFPTLYPARGALIRPIDVVRFSPDNAHALVNEGQEKVEKLAGNKVLNFSAFFDRTWRENDVLWGRLDGAEHIIRTLLPDGHPDLQDAIDKAQEKILEDVLTDEQKQQLTQQVQRLDQALHDAPLSYDTFGHLFGDEARPGLYLVLNLRLRMLRRQAQDKLERDLQEAASDRPQVLTPRQQDDKQNPFIASLAENFGPGSRTQAALAMRSVGVLAAVLQTVGKSRWRWLSGAVTPVLHTVQVVGSQAWQLEVDPTWLVKVLGVGLALVGIGVFQAEPAFYNLGMQVILIGVVMIGIISWWRFHRQGSSVQFPAGSVVKVLTAVLMFLGALKGLELAGVTRDGLGMVRHGVEQLVRVFVKPSRPWLTNLQAASHPNGRLNE
jgi:patatin-related protein